MYDLVLTGPRARTPDVLDTPDDDVPEPYPQSPPETDMPERQKSQAVGMTMSALQRLDALA